jgi:hypothetical protein
MRVMIKFAFPVEAGNAAIRDGKVEKVFTSILEELKPEVAYFFPEGGERAGLFVVNMTEPSQVAEIGERFFFGLNARIEMVPVVAPEDLRKGLSGIQVIIQRYG